MALVADNIQITYAAPAGCPSDATFLWQVRSRIHEVHALAAHYEVVLSSEGRQMRGVLRVEEENREAVRELAGASCDEVAEGLALIMALLIDPGASTAPARDLPPATPPPVEEAPPRPAPPVALRVPSDTAVAPHPPPPRSRHASIEAGGTLFLRDAIAPGLNVSGRIFLAAEMVGTGFVPAQLPLAFELCGSRPSLRTGRRAD